MFLALLAACTFLACGGERGSTSTLSNDDEEEEEINCGELEECDGQCRDLDNDPEHCGACGETCDEGQVCAAGECTSSCGDQLSECDGACRDLENDPRNCGACGEACDDDQVCRAGECASSCSDGQEQCDGQCRDLDSDSNHCGSCGNACAPGTGCVHGQCTEAEDYPSAVPGLTLWLAADTGVSTENGRITEWADQSGEENDATGPSEDDERPELLVDRWGNHDAIYFDGRDDSLSLPSGFNNFENGLTLFIVARQSGEREDARFLELGRGAADDNIVVSRDGRSDDLKYEVFEDENSAGEVIAEDGLPGRNYSLHTISHDPDEGVEIFDGDESLATLDELTTPRNTERTENLIGGTNWSDVEPLEGYIIEILLYDGVLSKSDRDNINLYLADKYELYHPRAKWLEELDDDARKLADDHRFHDYQLERDVYSSLPTAPDCEQHLSDGHDRDGLYRVEPAGAERPVLVSCDMTSQGGGWYELSLDENQHILVAENRPDNPWHKCADDSARYFGSVDGEGSVTPDYSDGNQRYDAETLAYTNPHLEERYDDEQLDLLRDQVSELHLDTRMVALTSDDDDGDWHNTKDHGHEVYVRGDGEDWKWLTVGNDGQCGDSDNWPYGGSQSGYYLWHSSADNSIAAGDTTATNDDVNGLDDDLLIPRDVRIEIRTGGGAAFGWE
ncbi:MAG: MXAN_6577-like cysteine-rich protein, partial [Persicimonas sp.]